MAVEVDAAGDAAPPALGLTHVPLVGCGYSYTGSFAIGDTAFRLMIDTGSNALAVAGAACSTCTAGGVAAPLYVPGASAMDLHEPASATYDAGEIMWQGEAYSDLVATGDLPPLRVGLADIAAQTDFFYAGMCGDPQGILGMSPIVPGPGTSPFSYPTALAASGAQDLFAMHYCGASGDLWLDGYDPATALDDIQWADMTGTHAYEVALDDVAVDGTSAGVPASAYGLAIVDSGGPNLIVPSAAFTAITTAIAASPAFQSRFGDASWFTGTNTCKVVQETRAQLDAALPKLTVQIGSPPISIVLPATAGYIQSFPGSGGTAYCPAIDASTFTDLGNTLLRAGLVLFDRAHGRLGVAPTVPCDD